MEHIGGFDLMILTETNIIYQVYFKNSMGYDVLCSNSIMAAEGYSQGGVGMIAHNRYQGWIIGSMRFHGMNVVSCKVVAGKRTLLIGA